MKELSVEQKAKRYDEAIKQIKECTPDENGFITIYPQEIFPELKENKELDDEKIIKWLIEIVEEIRKTNSTNASHNGMCSDAITWLEKQANHANFRNKIQIGDKVTRNRDGILVNLSQLNRVAKKQGEQKPADKVESKFHEGEWVFIEEVKGYKQGPFQIKSVDKFGYNFDEYHTIPFMYEELLSKWTIQDAKDGDVLTYNDSKNNIWVCIFKEYANERVYDYCTLDKESFWEHGNWNYLASFSYTPATKEQRDLLFQKMKEAGYEWDAEKKELKKIKQKQVVDYPDSLPKDNWELVHEFVGKFGRIPKDEDELNVLVKYILKRLKPTWSEEDNQYLCGLIGLIEQSKAELPITLKGKAADNCIEWLKSLRPQSHWKPTDEQMNAFDAILVYNPPCSNECRNHLITLYNELKKLREE